MPREVGDAGSEQTLKVEGGDAGSATAVTARYEGIQEDDFTYLQIDVGELPPGTHKLTVEVTDIHAGLSVQRAVLFRVVGTT